MGPFNMKWNGNIIYIYIYIYIYMCIYMYIYIYIFQCTMLPCLVAVATNFVVMFSDDFFCPHILKQTCIWKQEVCLNMSDIKGT